jgi:septum formation topological specificity factor MinE
VLRTDIESRDPADIGKHCGRNVIGDLIEVLVAERKKKAVFVRLAQDIGETLRHEILKLLGKYVKRRPVNGARLGRAV